MTVLTDTASREKLKNAIFTICGSQNPTRGCLDQIGRDAAHLVHKSRPWSGSWLYVLLHLDRYNERYNNGHVKYGIHPKLLSAILQLAKSEVLNGKRSVALYAEGKVREGAIVFGRCRKCARRRCNVWFVSDSTRQYCSNTCRHMVDQFRRKQETKRRRSEERRVGKEG